MPAYSTWASYLEWMCDICRNSLSSSWGRAQNVLQVRSVHGDCNTGPNALVFATCTTLDERSTACQSCRSWPIEQPSQVWAISAHAELSMNAPRWSGKPTLPAKGMQTSTPLKEQPTPISLTYLIDNHNQGYAAHGARPFMLLLHGTHKVRAHLVPGG